MPEHGHSPLSHVVDHPTLELPHWRPPTYMLEVELPELYGLQITRFMVTELIAAALMLLVLPLVVSHIKKSHVSRGWFMNLFEALLLFIRYQVARPAIGGHGARRSPSRGSPSGRRCDDVRKRGG